MRCTSRILIACMVVLGSYTALAQTPVTGLYAFGSYDNKGFDTINRGNLNVHFSIPILSKTGRGGTNFYYALNYDGLVWSPVSSSGTATWTPSYEWGWTDTTNAEFGYVTYDLYSINCGQFPQVYLEWEANNFVYHDAHGLLHPFPMTWSGGCNTGNYGPPTGTGTYTTSDNSGYTIYEDNSTYIAFSKGGAQSVVAAYANLDGVDNPDQGEGAGTFEDTNGNEISATSAGVFTDTTGGNPVLTVTGSGTPTSPLVYTYTDSNGTQQTVKVNYTQIDVVTKFNCNGIHDYGPVLTNLVTSIVYSADNSSYSFSYEQTPGLPGHVTGRLASVTLPTGGMISYSYSGGGCSGFIETDGTTPELERTTADSPTPTTYTRSNITSSGSTTTIVDPVGETGVYTLLENASGFFYENSHSLYNGSPSGTPVEQVTTCYNQSYPCSSPNVNSAFSTIAVNTVRDGVTVGTDTQTFTGPELLSTDAGPTGITTTDTYQTLTGPYSIPFYRIAGQTVQTSGTTNAQTTYKYDETTPTTRSGLPQHVSITTQRGNLTSVHQLVSGSTTITTATMTYDVAGQVQTVNDANGNTTTYGYDYPGTDTFLTTLTLPTTSDGVPQTASAKCDVQSGLMTSSTDENSQATTYTYDGLERPKTITYPDGGNTTYTYTPYSSSAPASAMQAVLQSGTATLNTTVVLDGYGRQVHLDYPNGSVADTIYGTSSRVYQVTNPHFTGGSSTDGTTTYAYDVLNRVTSVENPDSTTRTAQFNGLTETDTDESSNKKEYIADALGHIVEVLESNTTGALTWETDYTWNALNELHTVTQKGDGSANRVRTFNYDNMGRLTSQVTPEQGTTTYGYDKNSNLTSRVDARSITTTIGYDQLNRMISKLSSDGSVNYNYSYDASGSGFSIGRLTHASNNINAAFNPYYDSMGRVIKQTQCIPSDCSYDVTVSATYDKAGEMTTLTYPDTRVMTQNWLNGQLTSVTYTGWNGQTENVAYMSGVTYGPPANMTAETFGNGVQVQAGDNSRVLLSSLLYKTSAVTLWSKQYTWYPNGMNLKTLTDALNSANTMSYTYDPDNRIASASGAGASETYTADAWGNLKQSGNPYNFTQNFSANNRISATGYTYDASGDLTADGNGNSYTYNADQMITASSGASYVYDALDERVEKTGGSNAGETIYFNRAPIALLDAGTYTDLIYANGQMIAEVAGTQTAVPVYRMEDHLGSLAVQTDNSGNVTGTNTFLPFGQLLSTSTTDEFQFTELPQDTENSSYHAGYRNFSYQQGRWLSPDPSNGSYDITNPQSFNRYSYVMNNPMGFVDPSGLYDFTESDFGDEGLWGWGDEAWNPCGEMVYTIEGMEPCFGGGGGVGFIWVDPSEGWPGIPFAGFPAWGGGGGGNRSGGAGPVTYAPNNQNCAVTVKCRGIQTDNLGALGFQHCDAQVTDSSGATHSDSGGPMNYQGEQVLNAWDTSPPTEPFTGNTVYTGKSCSVAGCVINSTQTWNKGPLWPLYNPFVGPNSNTFLKQTFASCGVSLPINTWGSIW